MNRTLLACCALLMLLAACGSANGAGRASDVRVEVRLVTFETTPSEPLTTQSFSLTCSPTGGTLPFAARICNNIRRYPTAMLDPCRSRPCVGCPTSGTVLDYQSTEEAVIVGVTAAGKTTRFTGFRGGCGAERIGGNIFFAAAKGYSADLDRIEPLLRCAEDPSLSGTAQPQRVASQNACLKGQWTPRTERLIRIAAKTPELAGLQPAKLFPRDLGAQPCVIRSARGGMLTGLCGVYLKNGWGGTPVISFVESWTDRGSNGRHTWRVVLRNDRVVSVMETGPTPPQLAG